MQKNNTQIQNDFDINSNSKIQLCKYLDIDLLPIKLCNELRKIYDYEIAKGNIVVEVNLYGWSKIDLQIVFANPLFFRNIHISKAKYFENHDSHYPLEAEFTVARQCISGPLNEEEMKVRNEKNGQDHYITVTDFRP